MRSVEEMVRTLKLDLEDRVKSKVNVHHSMFAWLFEHAVDLHNKVLTGADGKSAYQRLKRKRYSGEFYSFVPRHVPGGRKGPRRVHEGALVRRALTGEEIQLKREHRYERGQWRGRQNPLSPRDPR